MDDRHLAAMIRAWDRLRAKRLDYTLLSKGDVVRTAFLGSLVAAEHQAFARHSRTMRSPELHVIYADRFPDERRRAPARSYARAEKYTGRIEVLAKVFLLPIENVLGLLYHELGHLADDDFGAPGAEQRADDIAEAATGHRINYDRYDVQTIGRGRWPRPLHLHR